MERSPTEGARILVIDGNLLTAEAIVLALSQIHFTARFALPVAADHVRDLVSWKPGLALIDIDSVDPATSIECVSILRDAEIPVAVMGGSRTASSSASASRPVRRRSSTRAHSSTSWSASSSACWPATSS